MISWGTDQRYIVQENSPTFTPDDWIEVDRFEHLDDAFVTIRDQNRLMKQGRTQFPDQAEAYDRTYRVWCGRTHREILWAAHDWVMPQPPPPTNRSDHMMDAMTYISQGAELQDLRRSLWTSTI